MAKLSCDIYLFSNWLPAYKRELNTSRRIHDIADACGEALLRWLIFL